MVMVTVLLDAGGACEFALLGISTRPSFSSVAEWRYRAVIRLAVGVNTCAIICCFLLIPLVAG